MSNRFTVGWGYNELVRLRVGMGIAVSIVSEVYNEIPISDS